MRECNVNYSYFRKMLRWMLSDFSWSLRQPYGSDGKSGRTWHCISSIRCIWWHEYIIWSTHNVSLMLYYQSLCTNVIHLSTLRGYLYCTGTIMWLYIDISPGHLLGQIKYFLIDAIQMNTLNLYIMPCIYITGLWSQVMLVSVDTIWQEHMAKVTCSWI